MFRGAVDSYEFIKFENSGGRMMRFDFKLRPDDFVMLSIAFFTFLMFVFKLGELWGKG